VSGQVVEGVKRVTRGAGDKRESHAGGTRMRTNADTHTAYMCVLTYVHPAVLLQHSDTLVPAPMPCLSCMRWLASPPPPTPPHTHACLMSTPPPPNTHTPHPTPPHPTPPTLMRA
jgi:hypothetical protein